MYDTGPGHNPLLEIRSETNKVYINAYGFRGPDYSLGCRNDVVRIITLGGSSTFNYHDPEQQTWPKLLERCLNEHGHNTEIINLSLPGFDSFTSKINYLVNGRPFCPHAVIVYHTWNDLRRMRQFRRDPRAKMFAGVAGRAYYGLPLPIVELTSKLQSVRLLRKFYYIYNAQNREGWIDLDEDGQGSWRPGAEDFAWFETNLRDLMNFARHDDVVPVLATQGTLIAEDVSDEVRRNIGFELIGMKLDDLVWAHAKASAIIRDIAQEEGATLVDIYAELPHSLDFFEDHVHLTPKGQVKVAAAFCNRLLTSDALRSLDDH